MGLTQITTGGVDDNINIDSNTLKVDGTNNRVGIATASPQADLDISPASSSATLRVHARTDSSPVPAIELVRGATSSFGTDTRQDFRLKNSGGELIVEYGQGGTTTEALRVNSVGRVGIGTTSPSDLLEINPTSTREGLTLKTTGTTFGGINIDTNRTGAGQTLGDIRFMWDGTGVAGITGHTGSDTTNKDDGRLIFNTASSGSATERMRIDSSGNVGIGTSSPAHGPLHVHSSSTAAYFHLTNSTTGSGTSDGFSLFSTGNDVVLDQRESANMRFFTANTEAMRIDSAGRGGIGTTNPVADLGVSNGGASGIELQPEITTNTNRITNYNRSASSYNNFRLDAARHEFLVSGSEKVRIDSSGNVSIGTTAGGYKLHVAGTILIGQANSLLFGSTSGPAPKITNSGQQNSLSFFTNGSESARIDSSGRLLVGTTSTLQANDKISVDGQVGIGGQRYGFLSKNVNVGNSVTFDIVGDVNNLVFVRVRITVGYTGNSNYQMHAQYDYLTCNFSTTGGSATITNIAQIESGNAQFNTSDWSVSRPANRTVRLTYSPSSGSGTHHPTVYVDGLFSTIS